MFLVPKQAFDVARNKLVYLTDGASSMRGINSFAEFPVSPVPEKERVGEQY